MRSKEFEGWVEAKECWRKAQVKSAEERGDLFSGIEFERVQNLYSHWWMDCAANKHGWDTGVGRVDYRGDGLRRLSRMRNDPPRKD